MSPPTWSPMVTLAAEKATLKINFVIVGAGVAGLTTAIALRRVGHRVLVVEKETDLNQDLGGCRMPPNLSKILYSWGLEDYLRTVAIPSAAVELHIQETGEFIGKHEWTEEVLRETRGEFIFAKMGKLRQLLHEVAVSCGATVKLGAVVTSIDPDDMTVTLASGYVHPADVIVGADGAEGISRSVFAQRNVFIEPPPESNANMYCAVVPQTAMLQVPVLKDLYDRDQTTLFGWFGDGHAVLAFKVGGPTSDFGMYVYGPKDGNEGTWDDLAPEQGLRNMLANSEHRLQELSQMVLPPTCVPVCETMPLEDWFTGRLVLVGAAAHQLPPGSIQDCAMAVEDAAVFGKLFSHLSSEEQIDSFLEAFQEIRAPRLRYVHETEIALLQYMMLPPGPAQIQRDTTMRIKRDAGMNVLDGSIDIEESPEWVKIKVDFGYDAEDVADAWWQEWGLLRERSRGQESLFPKIFYSSNSQISSC
ncbi:hypothetical protein C8J56DRAFT_1161571 [Mycena floridula]|nr:hypothetical protein C8J56DRAFT_1161571 [Mycena floridula]